MKKQWYVIILFISALGFMSCNLMNPIFYDNIKPLDEVVVSPVKLPAVIGTPVPTLPYGAGWMVYHDPDFGYFFNYPNSWKLIKDEESKSINLFPVGSNPDFPSPMIHIEVVDSEYSSAKTLVQTESSIQVLEVAGLPGKYYTDSEFSLPEQSSYIELPLKDKTLFIVTTIGPSIDLSNQLFEILKTLKVE